MSRKMVDRAWVKKVIFDFKHERDLELSDLAAIMGVSRDYLCVSLYTKSKRMTEDTAMKLLYPLLFAEGVERSLLPEKTRPDLNAIKWSQPAGYVEAEPVRSAMLRLKEELNTDWSRLAEYIGEDRRVFARSMQSDRKWMAEDVARRYRKAIGSIRSLSSDAKRSFFTPKDTSNTSVVDRRRLIANIRAFREDFSLTWKQVADEMGVSCRRLESHVKSLKDHPKMRKAVHDDLDFRLRAAINARRVAANTVIGNLDRDYGITDGGEKRRKREQDRRVQGEASAEAA